MNESDVHKCADTLDCRDCSALVLVLEVSWLVNSLSWIERLDVIRIVDTGVAVVAIISGQSFLILLICLLYLFLNFFLSHLIVSLNDFINNSNSSARHIRLLKLNLA